ncbi:2596_t:CDS:2, partial [Paraglomus brasilianum]
MSTSETDEFATSSGQYNLRKRKVTTKRMRQESDTTTSAKK